MTKFEALEQLEKLEWRARQSFDEDYQHGLRDAFKKAYDIVNEIKEI